MVAKVRPVENSCCNNSNLIVRNINIRKSYNNIYVNFHPINCHCLQEMTMLVYQIAHTSHGRLEHSGGLAWFGQSEVYKRNIHVMP